MLLQAAIRISLTPRMISGYVFGSHNDEKKFERWVAWDLELFNSSGSLKADVALSPCALSPACLFNHPRYTVSKTVRPHFLSKADTSGALSLQTQT
jgi:hypothetical protein